MKNIELKPFIMKRDEDDSFEFFKDLENRIREDIEANTGIRETLEETDCNRLRSGDLHIVYLTESDFTPIIVLERRQDGILVAHVSFEEKAK